MSQVSEIEKYLRKHTITSMEAIMMFGCTRLADVIFRLRCQGHEIITETVYKNGKRFGRYKLVGGK